MFLENFYAETKWKPIDNANNGDNVLIQNCGSEPCEFIVLDHSPIDGKDLGGCLQPKQQLSFKKVSGDLYVRCHKRVRLHVEKVEE